MLYSIKTEAVRTCVDTFLKEVCAVFLNGGICRVKVGKTCKAIVGCIVTIVEIVDIL